MNIGIERATCRHEITRIVKSGSYSPAQRHFLLRFNGLFKAREESKPYELPEELQKKLFDRAVYSTLLDCLEQGVGDDAKKILHFQEVVRQESKTK